MRDPEEVLGRVFPLDQCDFAWYDSTRYPPTFGRHNFSGGIVDYTDAWVNGFAP